MGSYQFRFQWRFLIATIVGIVLFINLGFWQLNRGHAKEIIIEKFQVRQNQPALSLQQLLLKKDKNYYPVSLKGTFDNQHIFLLDNETQNGKVGFDVIMPFKIQGSDQYILVNRGWVQAAAYRNQLPKIATINKALSLVGHIVLPSEQPFLLKAQKLNYKEWPLVIQTIDIHLIEKIIGKPIYNFILQLAPNSSYAFIDNWQAVKLRPQKHYAYAFQWFTFAFTLLVIFIGLNVKKRDNESEN